MRNKGQETERELLKKLGAHRQPASGAIPGFPNDGIKGRYLIEVKSTVDASLAVKRAWLSKLEENATLSNKLPAMIIVFNKSAVGLAPPFEEWVLVPRVDFEILTKGWTRK